MSTRTLARIPEKFPSLFNDYFKPWNEWYDTEGSLTGRMITIPPVNISETRDQFIVSLAAPGMSKEDFKIDVEGNMLTISSEKEEKLDRFTRKEYSYFSFSRSFTIPEEVNKEKIEASYENGILNLFLPRKEEFKKVTAKKIAVK